MWSNVLTLSTLEGKAIQVLQHLGMAMSGRIGTLGAAEALLAVKAPPEEVEEGAAHVAVAPGPGAPTVTFLKQYRVGTGKRMKGGSLTRTKMDGMKTDEEVSRGCKKTAGERDVESTNTLAEYEN